MFISLLKTMPTPGKDIRGFCRWIFFTLLGLSFVLYLFSYADQVTRLCDLATLILGIFTACVYLYRPFTRFWWVKVLTCALLGLLCFWAGTASREANKERLRQMYIQRLRAFAGTAYVWGGESHVGIDCSGLARVALIEAIALEGLREGNPRLLGPLLWKFWWRDMSAKDMLTGKYDYTIALQGDFSLLSPGDLAVNDNGMHVMIYLGDGRWIEADPGIGKVIIDAPITASKRAEFLNGRKLVRWWIFRDDGPA